jgi:uncharacterized protein (TIGR02246 family)
MGEEIERRAILRLIGEYEQAFRDADADRMQSLFWFDDARFLEIENHIPAPFGRERFLGITDWVRENQPSGQTMEFRETMVHLLSRESAYSVSLRDEHEGGQTVTSRVTLVYLKRAGIWKILHGHFSCLPDYGSKAEDGGSG